MPGGGGRDWVIKGDILELEIHPEYKEPLKGFKLDNMPSFTARELPGMEKWGRTGSPTFH